MNLLSELTKRVGETLPPSEWLAISQDMIDDFARVTGDDQWIHIDVERCRTESPYKAPIAHGLFVLSLIPKLMSRSEQWAKFSSGINYGCDKVRYPAPVRVGARIRAVQTLKSVEPFKQDSVKVAFAITIEIEGEKMPACYTELIAILFP